MWYHNAHWAISAELLRPLGMGPNSLLARTSNAKSFSFHVRRTPDLHSIKHIRDSIEPQDIFGKLAPV